MDMKEMVIHVQVNVAGLCSNIMELVFFCKSNCNGRLNFDGYCHKLESILNLWKGRDLSLIGKITILKCLVFQKLIYNLPILPSEVFPPFLKSLKNLYGLFGILVGKE